MTCSILYNPGSETGKREDHWREQWALMKGMEQMRPCTSD